jgi:orotate phosphoribosyltransferase-like protein
MFKFNYDIHRKINWRNISKADLRTISTGEDLSDILLNLEDIAYCDLE